ncbi:MAG: DUF2062 domain-containing protein [Desulfobacterales bacterium]|nr:DUF2062 domain-containing protein [Desulfobacterales bacterium]
MHPDEQSRKEKNTAINRLKQRLHDFIERAKKLQGDPHYIAVGMAIGVFVAITPTIPFHTAIALVLAFLLRGSKPAAVIAVWVSNPVTIPIFYLGSYKVGNFILGNSIPFDPKYESLSELAKLGADATIAMLVGGVILGIVPGIASYFITRKIFTTLRARRVDKHLFDEMP